MLTPLLSQVLLKVQPLPEKTGSIIRVERNEYARTAEVVAVGPECRDVVPGDVVLVGTLVGQAVEDKLLVPESAILAFVEAV
jgi:co-chaperonin GroES (HSP10)